MFLFLALCLFAARVAAEDTEIVLPRLTGVSAAELFIDSADVVVIGFFEADDAEGFKEFLAAVKEVKSLPAALCSEKEVWAKYDITSDTISIFRKADLHQEHLLLSKAKNLDTDRLTRYLTINNLQYLTEYNQVSAVGLFQSKVKVHLLLLANRGSSDFQQLSEQLRALAPAYAGKMLFVLVNGKLKSNARALEYFNLKSADLPRVGIYDADMDKKWLMPQRDISTEHVQNFCDSFLSGELQKQEEAEKKKTEL